MCSPIFAIFFFFPLICVLAALGTCHPAPARCFSSGLQACSLYPPRSPHRLPLAFFCELNASFVFLFSQAGDVFPPPSTDSFRCKETPALPWRLLRAVRASPPLRRRPTSATGSSVIVIFVDEVLTFPVVGLISPQLLRQPPPYSGISVESRTIGGIFLNPRRPPPSATCFTVFPQIPPVRRSRELFPPPPVPRQRLVLIVAFLLTSSF